MQAYIKYKAFYCKKTNASKLKKQQYVYVLQPKADHQGSKILFTDFRCISPYIVERALPNNNFLVQKLETNQNPGPSSHETTTIHAPTTHTRCTNNKQQQTASYSINGIKATARIRVEQDSDLVLKNLKLKILGQSHNDVLLGMDRR